MIVWLYRTRALKPKRRRKRKKPFPFPYKCERVHFRNFLPPPTIISMSAHARQKKLQPSLTISLFFLPECQFWRYPPFPPYLRLDHIFLLLLSAFFSLRFWTYYRFPLSPSFSFFSYYLWGERVGREVQNFPAIILPPSSQCESFWPKYRLQWVFLQFETYLDGKGACGESHSSKNDFSDRTIF